MEGSPSDDKFRKIEIRVPIDAVIDIQGLEKAILDQHETQEKLKILEGMRGLTLAQLQTLRTHVDAQPKMQPTQQFQQPQLEASRQRGELPQ